MARILILGGGCRGRRLAAGLLEEGHAVRITTRSHERRGEIEALGAECWVGTPDRLSTLRGSLDRVAVACWLLGTASGSPEELLALHTARLELFLTQTIDTTVRGFLYEARGTTTLAPALAEGLAVVRRLTERNRIPAAWLDVDPRDTDAWLAAARAAIGAFLEPGREATG